MQAIHSRLQPLSLLIAEDDESTRVWLARVMAIYFREVRVAKDAMQALELFTQSPSDIVISDIEMPSVNGLHLLHKIALLSPTTKRVVMTAYNNTEYINTAVEYGIDLYIKKPIDIDEFLVAMASSIAKEDLKAIPLSGGYFYDFNQKIALKDGKIIRLTKKEILLLELLLKNQKSVLSTEQIEHSIWEDGISSDAIRMVVAGIRKKLHSGVIENIKGVGYKIG